MRKSPFWIIFLFVTGVLAGCSGQVATYDEAVKDVREGERREEIVADSWSAAESGGDVDDGWLKSFNDPQLNALVDEALQNNFGLKIGAARVDQANALALQAGAALKPTVGLSGGYADRNVEDHKELYGGSLRISWEADVWGRVRSGVAGSEAAAAAGRSDYEYARQSLVAAVANGWFMACGADILHGYSKEIVEILSETVRISEVKERVGKGSMKDVHLARANMATAQDAERKAVLAKKNAVRSLELLLGRYPSAELEAAKELEAVPPPIPAGIPSQVLERRPDLIAAEQRVAAAFYKEKEAELMHLPRFNISLGLGLTNLADAATNLAAGIFAPLYTGGAIEAEVERATAVQKEAVAQYGQSALQAFNEVETSLSYENRLMEREAFLKAAVDENKKAYELTSKEYEVGKIELTSLLIVQDKWIQAEIAMTDVSVQRLVNRVGLHLALGGSFE